MNFLSHYHIHGTEVDEFNFGLLFPDFLGILNRSYKLSQFLHDYAGGIEPFVKGIDYHVRADAYWHGCAYFKDKCQLLKEVFQEYGFGEKPYRPFFMTHVALELLIDRQIVRDQTSLCEKMYASLAQLKQEFLQNLFQEKTETERMLSFLKNFVDNRYVFSYANNEMFVYALNRLFSRVRHPQLAFSNEENRDTFVDQLDNAINKDYTHILQTLSNEVE